MMGYRVTGIVLCIAVFLNYGQGFIAQSNVLRESEYNHESLQLNRIARRAQYEGPPPPPNAPDSPPQQPQSPMSWSEDAMLRTKREAKGVGGSMPTRKG